MSDSDKTMGIKYDSGKPDWSLMPFRELTEVVKVLTAGAVKYSPDNWKFVKPSQERYAAAALRHISARMQGEVKDPETGCPHTAHAICCLLFWMWHDTEAGDDAPRMS